MSVPSELNSCHVNFRGEYDMSFKKLISDNSIFSISKLVIILYNPVFQTLGKQKDYCFQP